MFVLKNKSIIIRIQDYKYLLLLFGFLLVGLTFLFGTYPGGEGPRLWLGAKGIYFQPSELLKLLLIAYLASYFSEARLQYLPLKKSILPTLVMLCMSLITLVAQRDLGTALIFISIYLFMLFTALNKKRLLAFGCLLILVVGITGYQGIDLVRMRLNSWIYPWLDTQSGSYQIIQSIIAIATGGLLGTGIGIGKPNFIPISHSDFIYASIVEETGLVGAIGLIILYAIVLFRLLRISLQAQNTFGQYFAAGVASYLTSQSILIMGGNTRLLPITGVTLPFVSYGGSSLVISFLSILLTLILFNSPIQNSGGTQIRAPIRILGFIFSSGLILVALVTGWWGVIRSADLQLREDNPRHLLTAQYVPRGEILDRNGVLLASTNGETGSFVREYTHPALSNTIGYINQQYGLAGLEKSLDEYLSGFRGYPSFNIWFNFLLYDQPPAGRDVRTTIDLDIQAYIDELLESHKASAVVMNAKTGDILAIASHPHYDANQLNENFGSWMDDEGAPFLNRAVQGAYPIGELITPFILSIEEQAGLSEDIIGARDPVDNNYPECAIEVTGNRTLSNTVANGCTTPLFLILQNAEADILSETVQIFSLDSTPEIGLPINEPVPTTNTINWEEGLFGEDPIRISPLRAATAFSVFSNQGLQATPNLWTAVNVYKEGWVIVSDASQKRILSTQKSEFIANLLKSSQIPGWELTTRGVDGTSNVSWYAAGTNAEWQGNPTVVVIVSEEDDPNTVRNLGRHIFNKAISE